MPVALILEFSTDTAKYHAVNAELGIVQGDPSSDWPAGMISHTGGAGDNGNLVVFEVWASKADHEAFMASRLGPALGKVGVPEPTRVEWFDVLGYTALPG